MRTAGPMYRGLIRSLMLAVGLTVVSGAAYALTEDEDIVGRGFFALGLLTVALGIFVALGAALRRAPTITTATISVIATVTGLVPLYVLLANQQVSRRMEEVLVATGVTGLYLGAAIAHTLVFRAIPARVLLLKVAKTLTSVFVWTFGSFLTFVLWFEEVFEQIISVAGALPIMSMVLMMLAAIVGTVVVPITSLSRANRDEDPMETMQDRLPVHLGCPKCGYRQTARVGPVRCENCRVQLSLEIEEPRCACGYLLFRLAAVSCPECGRPVPEDHAWAAPAGAIA